MFYNSLGFFKFQLLQRIFFVSSMGTERVEDYTTPRLLRT
jgi:hypothetical protein